MALASGWFAGRIRAHCLLPLVHLAKPRPACFCGGAQEAVDDRCAPAGNRLPHCGLSVDRRGLRSEEHTSELQSLMRISYAVFCLKKKNNNNTQPTPSPDTL